MLLQTSGAAQARRPATYDEYLHLQAKGLASAPFDPDAQSWYEALA